MAGIHITDIEAAINWWRARLPHDESPGHALAPEVAALAEVYALLVYYHEELADEGSMPPAARQAWLAWYGQTPDAPCIAICSTAQGDAVCKGCGRHEDEVQDWPVYTPAEKRAVWRRITLDGSAWRFNRYAERAALHGRSEGDAAHPGTGTPGGPPAAAAPDRPGPPHG